MAEPDERRIPASALALGLGGVIPFAACAAALYVLDEARLQAEAAQAMAAYGAVILSFLGGVRWGSALSLPRAQLTPELVLAVIPSLLGWCALLLPGTTQPLLALGLGFAVFGVLDVREGGRGAWPAWYPRLRFVLTLLVLACLVAALLAR
ncbi:MAG: DUF3429 domain-containing protein [Xanthomonadaceae bacterium]|jgi:hypothetical protein|nr:DUF3429 domain-containing protein [Xanthomonadaceae bacterium]